MLVYAELFLSEDAGIQKILKDKAAARRDQVNRLTSPSSMSGSLEWARWLRRS